MKRLIIIGVVAIVAAFAAGAYASSSVGWPTACRGFGCVDNHLNQLNQRVVALEAKVARIRTRNHTIATCVVEYPVTRYGNSDNYTVPFYNQNLGNSATAPGYFNDYNWYSQSFNELDQTHQGDNVGSWILRDTCEAPAFGRPPSP